MSASVHNAPPNLAALKSIAGRNPPRFRAVSVRCCTYGPAPAEVKVARRVTVTNGSDSLEICRVLNGMWQTSGGWGSIDRNNAVEAMLRYSDAGLSTFDMADHCK
ncbi:hypothetical protein LINPERHAP1_LOCUS33479 [Linum perenne]